MAVSGLQPSHEGGHLYLGEANFLSIPAIEEGKSMQSATFDKASKAQQDLYWANVWFGKMVQFHDKSPTAADWEFGAGEVIAFLRSKRDADVPAWEAGEDSDSQPSIRVHWCSFAVP